MGNAVLSSSHCARNWTGTKFGDCGEANRIPLGASGRLRANGNSFDTPWRLVTFAPRFLETRSENA